MANRREQRLAVFRRVTGIVPRGEQGVLGGLLLTDIARDIGRAGQLARIVGNRLDRFFGPEDAALPASQFVGARDPAFLRHLCQQFARHERGCRTACRGSPACPRLSDLCPHLRETEIARCVPAIDLRRGTVGPRDPPFRIQQQDCVLFERTDQQIEGLRQPQAFAGHTAFHVVEGTVEPGDLVASGISRYAAACKFPLHPVDGGLLGSLDLGKARLQFAACQRAIFPQCRKRGSDFAAARLVIGDPC